MTKKIIQRNLPLSETYSLVKLYTFSLLDGGYTNVCQNCDKLLVNYATIKDSKGKLFDVGVDCMKTLTMKPVLISSGYSSEDLQYDFNQLLSFFTACNYPDAEITTDGAHCIWVRYLNTNNGKLISKMQFVSTLKRFADFEDFNNKYAHKIKQL